MSINCADVLFKQTVLPDCRQTVRLQPFSSTFDFFPTSMHVIGQFFHSVYIYIKYI